MASRAIVVSSGAVKLGGCSAVRAISSSAARGAVWSWVRFVAAI